MTKAELEQLADKIAEQIGEEPALIKAIIATESSWDPDAESPYARGLMQVSKPALQTVNDVFEVGFTYDDMFDPEKNITAGTLYIRWLKRAVEALIGESEFSVAYAIMAYNWGIGNVMKWLSGDKDNTEIDETVPAETKAHLLDVMWWRAAYDLQDAIRC